MKPTITVCGKALPERPRAAVAALALALAAATAVLAIVSGVGLGSAYGAETLPASGDAWAWGDNTNGQLGNGTTADRTSPVKVRNLGEVVEVAGGGHRLALKTDGTLWAWGENSFGELGDGTTTSRNIPVMVRRLSGVLDISGSYVHGLAVSMSVPI